MKIPDSFKPDKEHEYNLKELENLQKKKIRNIKDLILETEEIGKSYSPLELERLTESRFKRYCGYIRWYDIQDNLLQTYDLGDDRRLRIQVLEYLSRDVLKTRLDNIYAEIDYHNQKALHPQICKALVVDRYAIVLKKYSPFIQGMIGNKRILNRIENIYRDKFGTKRLVSKKGMLIRKNNQIKNWVELE